MNRWDKIYKKEGKKYIGRLGYLQRLISFFKKNKVKKVLDIGCGTGDHILQLAKNGFFVYGIDSSEEAIALAKQKFKSSKLKGNLSNFSMHKKLPFKDCFFDAVISLRTLNHGTSEQIKRVIKEINRVNRKEGFIFITALKIPRPKTKKGITTLNKLKVKIIKPRTYFSLQGREKGITHYIFNKKILLSLLKDSKIINFWIEKGLQDWEKYYCILAKKKS